MTEFRIGLGTRVRDKVTGFEGIVTGQHAYLYGCIRYTVSAQTLKNGRPLEPLAADEEQLEVLEEPAEKQVAKPTGGPRSNPERRYHRA